MEESPTADIFRDHVMVLVREDDPSLATTCEKIKLLVMHANVRVLVCMRVCVRVYEYSVAAHVCVTMQ